MTVCVHSVVDEGEELAGGGHSADGLAPPIGDTVVVGPDGGGASLVGHRFDCSPAHQPGSLSCDVAPLHSGVRLPVAWGEASPAAQLTRTREAGDVADLGHEDGGQHGAHPTDGLDGPVTVVVVEGSGNASLEHGHLPVDDLDDVAQGLDPGGVGGAEGAGVEQGLSGHAEQIRHVHGHALLGQHGVHLGFEPGA